MLGPQVLSRVEGPYVLSGLGVNPREIRSLGKIALLTGKAKVGTFGRSALFSGDDVLDVMGIHQPPP
jgi:hypothetical protein